MQVRELTAVVRNQIPSGRKSLLDAYAEVVFQAWRHTQGACRYEVEQTLLQVPPPPSPATHLRVSATTSLVLPSGACQHGLQCASCGVPRMHDLLHRDCWAQSFRALQGLDRFWGFAVEGMSCGRSILHRPY